MRGLWLLTGLCLLGAGAAQAQVETVSARPDRAAVVVYRDRPVDTAALMEESQNDWNGLDQEGLALIVETRTIDLPAGEGLIRLRGVATGIVPQTATLDGLPAQVVERNTDFDLLSPGSLLEHSVGETVRVVRTNPATGERVEKAAIVRSGPDGTVLEIDGRLEALSCSGLTERIIFDRAPEGLSDQPVLSVRTRAPTAGRYTVTLAYLATGLQWSADYVARLAPDGRTLDLSGWITLANFGGTGFPDAPVQVVAGNLNRDEDTVPVDPVEVTRAPRCWPMDRTTGSARRMMTVAREELLGNGRSNTADDLGGQTAVEEIVVTGSRIVERGELGDYKIYTLPEHTDVDARQTKQVRFIDQHGVRFTRTYAVELYEGNDDEPHPAVLMLRLRNEAGQGLGLPLPGGSVSLIEAGGGQPLFAGQARFNDKAVGLPVELRFGEAMDLTVEQETGEHERVGDLVRVPVTVTIRNDKPQPVEIEVRPGESGYPGFRILRSSARSVITEGGYPAWRLRLPAGGRTILTYTIEYAS